MRAHLLDVNVLLALAWPEHEFHSIAHRWFERKANKGWATCAITQSGFIRISSNPKMSGLVISVSDAVKALTASVQHPHHEFWKDEISYTEAAALIGEGLVGHRQVTDAYLIGLAIHKGGTFATLDRSTSALLSSSSPHRQHLEVIS